MIVIQQPYQSELNLEIMYFAFSGNAQSIIKNRDKK